MPFRIIPIVGTSLVQVYDKNRLIAKHSTLNNAKKQVHLIRAIDHGFKPTNKSNIEKPKK